MGKKRDKHRALLLKEYGRLYKRHIYDGSDSVCFYCGDNKHHMDHVPPLSIVDYATPERLRMLKIPMVLIPCCGDCNIQLGAKRLGTVEERLSYLYGYLTSKVEREIALWSEPEIEEMSPMFQKMIRSRRAKFNILIERLRGVEDRLCRPETYP